MRQFDSCQKAPIYYEEAGDFLIPVNREPRRGNVAWLCRVYQGFRVWFNPQVEEKVTLHFLGCRRYFNMVTACVLTVLHLKIAILHTRALRWLRVMGTGVPSHLGWDLNSDSFNHHCETVV